MFPEFNNKTKILYTERKPKPVPPPFVRNTCPNRLRSKPISTRGVNKVKTNLDILDESEVNNSPGYRIDINSRLDWDHTLHNNWGKCKQKKESLFRK